MSARIARLDSTRCRSRGVGRALGDLEEPIELAIDSQVAELEEHREPRE